MDIKIEIDSNEYIICNGIKLNIQKNEIFDIQNQGYDPINFIETRYKKEIVRIRDIKISKILKKYARIRK